jgi:hypothetical protein
VRNLQVLDPRKQDLNGTPAQIVRHDQVRIYLVQSRDEGLQHLLLIVEDQHRRLRLFRFLLSIIGQGSRVQFADHSEVLEFLFLRRTILLNLVLHNTGNHRDLSGILL